MIGFLDKDVFFWQSIIYCVLIMLSTVPVAIIGPRMLLQDYPREIQNVVPPKTQKEKSQGIFFAIPIILVMIGYPIVVSWYYRPAEPHFVYYFVVTWGMMLVFNVFDLLVLDWIMFCWITPKFMVIKGTEGHAGYKNYFFHFIGFLKGIVITGIIGLIAAGVMSLG